LFFTLNYVFFHSRHVHVTKTRNAILFFTNVNYTVFRHFKFLYVTNLCCNQSIRRQRQADVEIFARNNGIMGVRSCTIIQPGTLIFEYILEAIITAEFQKRHDRIPEVQPKFFLVGCKSRDWSYVQFCYCSLY
jgi:hypothetical protein